MDAPNIRKIHLSHTPSMGGIPIFLGTAFSLIIWLPYEASLEYKYLFGSLALIFVIGLRDDLIPLRPIYKLLSQMIPAIIVIYLTDIELVSFYGLLDFEFSEAMSWIITLFVIVVITNSFNLIDGLDGLAGTLSFISLTSMGTWFYLVGLEHISYILFAFMGAIMAFLLFNWHPSKIFMGDTGALLLGFLLAYLVIHFINVNYNLSDFNDHKFNAPISAAICFLMVPLMDTIRIFVLRVFNGKSPFGADKNHIHHILVHRGLSHSWVAIILGITQLGFIVIAVLGKNSVDKIMLPIIIGLCLIFYFFISIISKANTQKAPVQ